MTIRSHPGSLSRLLFVCFSFTLFFMAAPPVPAQVGNVHQSVLEEIQNLESRLQENLPPNEETALLWQLSERARLVNDNVRVRYALTRLRESPGWAEFPWKRDALLQAALLEERFSRFGPAAELYGKIVREEIPRPSPLTIDSPYVGYALRWAECLENCGDNGRAAEIYQDLLTDMPQDQASGILIYLIRNYRYGRPSPDDIERLAERVRAIDAPTLQWELAKMYVGKGLYDKAVEIFDRFWPDQAKLAVECLDEFLTAYRATGKLDTILQDAETHVQDRHIAHFLAAAYQRLGMPEQSLSVIRRCRESTLESLAAKFNISPASAAERLPVPLTTFLPEFNALEYEALRAVADATAALDFALRMCRQKSREIRWYEAATARADVDPVPLWRLYIEANDHNPSAYQQAARSLAQLHHATEALDLLREGASQAPGVVTALAYADALIADGSCEGALQQYRLIRAQNWAQDYFLAKHIEPMLDQPDLSKALRSLLKDRLKQPQTESWEDQVLREILYREGDLKTLLDWASRDTSGAAAVDLAQWALYKGFPKLALEAYQSVPPDSLYRDTARIEMARVLRDLGREDVETCQRIAGLLDPIVSEIKVEPADSPVAKYKKLEILDLWARVKISGTQGMEVLQRLYTIFGQDRQAVLATYPDLDTDCLLLLRGLALSQVGSLAEAIEEFHAVRAGPFRSEADFYEARALFWQEDYDKSRTLFEHLVTDPTGWRFMNDGLQYLTFFQQLSFGSLQLLSRAAFLVWQGRWEDAESVFRDLSVEENGNDIGEWARYQIGQSYLKAGKLDRAVTEWNGLSQDGRYAWLRNRLGLELAAHLPSDASDEIRREKWLKAIITGDGDTLLSDLARLKLKRSTESVPPSSRRSTGDV